MVVENSLTSQYVLLRLSFTRQEFSQYPSSCSGLPEIKSFRSSASGIYRRLFVHIIISVKGVLVSFIFGDVRKTLNSGYDLNWCVIGSLLITSPLVFTIFSKTKSIFSPKPTSAAFSVKYIFFLSSAFSQSELLYGERFSSLHFSPYAISFRCGMRNFELFISISS